MDPFTSFTIIAFATAFELTANAISVIVFVASKQLSFAIIISDHTFSA